MLWKYFKYIIFKKKIKYIIDEKNSKKSVLEKNRNQIINNLIKLYIFLYKLLIYNKHPYFCQIIHF